MDVEYRLYVLVMMMVSVFGNGWLMSALSTDVVVDAMASDGFASEMVRNMFYVFVMKYDVDVMWVLDEEVVC